MKTSLVHLDEMKSLENDWTWPFRYQNKCHLRHRLRWKAAAYESYRRDNFTICIGVFIWCDSKRMWSDSLGDNHDEHKYRIDLVVCGSFIVRILVLPEELTENIWLPHGNLWIIATKKVIVDVLYFAFVHFMSHRGITEKKWDISLFNSMPYV